MNEIKEQQLTWNKGMTNVPSDLLCSDNTCEAEVNMVYRNGEHRPIQDEKVMFDGEGKHRLLFVHKNNGYTHYIADNDNTLIWYDEKGNEKEMPSETPKISGTPNIQAVGNVLIVALEEYTMYFIWKRDEDDVEGYKYLGTKVPEVRMEFALRGDLVGKSFNRALTTKNADTGSYKTGGQTPDYNWEIITQQLCQNKTWGIQSNPKVDSSNLKDYSTKLDCKLTKNKEYRLHSPNDKVVYMGIYGIDSEGNFARLYNGRANKGYKYFTAQADYPEVYAVMFSGPTIRKDGTSFIYTTIILEEGSEIPGLTYVVQGTEENHTSLMSIMNQFNNKYATTKNRFIYPFFVRYATRMYDGSQINLSPPILLRPNTGYVPMMTFVPSADSQSTEREVLAYAFVADLEARAVEEISDDWGELIQGVSIYISRPILPYVDEGFDSTKEQITCKGWKIGKDSGKDVFNQFEGVSYSYMASVYGSKRGDGTVYQDRLDLFKCVKEHMNLSPSVDTDYELGLIEVSARSDEQIMGEVASTSNFFLAKTYKLDEINGLVTKIDVDDADTDFSTVTLDEGVLSTLETREALDESVMDSRTMMSGTMLTYNSRLAVFSMKYKLQEPFYINTLNGAARRFFQNSFGSHISVKLNIDGETKVVNYSVGENEVAYYNIIDEHLVWYYYPDNRATEITIARRDAFKTVTHYITIPLKRHDYLNGAYWMQSKMDGGEAIGTDLVEGGVVQQAPGIPTENNTVTDTTTLYISEVNNPWVFKSKGVVSLNYGNIQALTTITKALSQGQFGQYPLLAFTDMGIWALSLDSEGYCSAVSPMSREICNNTDSIVQTDDAVFFSSEKGLMTISGGDVVCVSQQLSGKNAETGGSEYSGLDIENYELDFHEYLKECRNAYDFRDRLLWIMRADKDYAYIYSIDDGTFAIKKWDERYWQRAVNDYPDTLLQDGDGKVYTLLNRDNINDEAQSEEGKYNCAIVSRPMKWENSTALKTLMQIKTICMLGHEGSVKIYLYASADCKNWVGVTSLRGRGFKYWKFKILLTALTAVDTFSGMLIHTQERYTNKMR